MRKAKRVPINRRDYDRVLITETLPYETPVIFSGEGLYDCVRARNDSGPGVMRSLLDALVLNDTAKPSHTIPLRYKVRKNSKEFRRLSVLHPRAQWRIRKFYESYENLVIYYCSQSPASIRAPRRIAGSFFRRSSWENMHKYKGVGVATLSMEDVARHSPSFFAYRGYDRLFKFYASPEFARLEKQFEHLWTLDVSKCFDSIYTHCLSWVIKDKDFTKRHRGVGETFAQEFDALMRFSNHDETNGIPIGPEVSRIFAEILFQQVDLTCIERLKLPSPAVEFGVDYVLRRYVDDVFIFARSADVAAQVYDCYADALTTVNLNANGAKSLRSERPFVTTKSRLVHDLTREVDHFIDRFLVRGAPRTVLEPLPIHEPWSLSRSFLDAVKARCAENAASYDEVASYVISMLCERVKNLTAAQVSPVETERGRLFSRAMLVLLDVVYFLYGVAPSVAASYKVSTCVVLISRFVRRNVPLDFPEVAQRIYDLTVEHLAQERSSSARMVNGFLPLETLNVLIAARELGSDYLLPPRVVEPLFSCEGELSYFQITSCLYYVKDEARYSAVRERALEHAARKLLDLGDVASNTEKAFLLLDMLSCPYVDPKLKRRWVVDAFSALSLPAPSGAPLDQFLASSDDLQWQVNWSGVDLLNVLEKKELKQVYA